MFKMMKEKAPNYIINIVAKCVPTIRTRDHNLPSFNYQVNCLRYTFILSTVSDWFNLDLKIRNAEPVLLFKSRLLSFILLVQRSIYNIFDPAGLKFLTRLRFGFSHHLISLQF